MDNNLKDNYREQTEFGNVYNFFIEFVMANEFIKKLVNSKDEKSLNIIKNGIQNSFDEAIKYIKNQFKQPVNQITTTPITEEFDEWMERNEWHFMPVSFNGNIKYRWVNENLSGQLTTKELYDIFIQHQ
jgi:hypothetical protein